MQVWRNQSAYESSPAPFKPSPCRTAEERENSMKKKIIIKKSNTESTCGWNEIKLERFSTITRHPNSRDVTWPLLTSTALWWGIGAFYLGGLSCLLPPLTSSILHLFGDFVRIKYTRNGHLDLALLLLSPSQFRLSLLQVEVAVIVAGELLKQREIQMLNHRFRVGLLKFKFKSRQTHPETADPK